MAVRAGAPRNAWSRCWRRLMGWRPAARADALAGLGSSERVAPAVSLARLVSSGQGIIPRAHRGHREGRGSWTGPRSWIRAAPLVALGLALGLGPSTQLQAQLQARSKGGPVAEAFALYAKGDYPAAAVRLTPLAEAGNPRAQALLGFLYEHGHGVPQDFAVAAWWYASAAEQGEVTAQYLLGLAYDAGRGVPGDVVLSQKWLILAAARADRAQRDTYTRIRDAVATKMSRAQIQLAQQLALAWTQANPR